MQNQGLKGCAFQRGVSQSSQPETCPSPLHPSLPGNAAEEKRPAVLSTAPPQCLCCLSPTSGVGGLLPIASAWLRYPSPERGPFHYSSLEMNPSLEAVSLQGAGDVAFLSCTGQSSSMSLGLGDLSTGPVLISFTAPCGCCHHLQNNKRLWKQWDFTAYLLSPRELPNASVRSCTGLHPRPRWHQLHNATCAQPPWDGSSMAGTWLQRLGARDRARW